MEDEDENNIENTSRYEKSGVPLAWLGLEELISVLLPSRSELVPAVSAMVNWLEQEIVLSASFSRCYPQSPLISLFYVLNSTIT